MLGARPVPRPDAEHEDHTLAIVARGYASVGNLGVAKGGGVEPLVALSQRDEAEARGPRLSPRWQASRSGGAAQRDPRNDSHEERVF